MLTALLAGKLGVPPAEDFYPEPSGERDNTVGLFKARARALFSAGGELAAHLFAIFGPFSTLLLG